MDQALKIQSLCNFLNKTHGFKRDLKVEILPKSNVFDERFTLKYIFVQIQLSCN